MSPIELVTSLRSTGPPWSYGAAARAGAGDELPLSGSLAHLLRISVSSLCKNSLPLRLCRRPLPLDPAAEPNQQITEYFAGALVVEPKLGVEALVCLGHQKLGWREQARVHVSEQLSQVVLGPRGTGLTRRGTHQRDRLACQWRPAR